MNEQIEKITSCMMELVEVPENIESAIEVENFLKSYKDVFMIYATHLHNSGCHMYTKDSVMLTGEAYERFMGHTINIRKIRREAVVKLSEKIKGKFEALSSCGEVDTLPISIINGLINDACIEVLEVKVND